MSDKNNQYMYVFLEPDDKFKFNMNIVMRTTRETMIETIDELKKYPEKVIKDVQDSILECIIKKSKDWNSISDDKFKNDVLLYEINKMILTNKPMDIFEGTLEDLRKLLKK